MLLCVKSLTAKSISNIIEKSPNLITLYVFLNTKVFLESDLIALIASIKTKLILFNGGKFDLRQINDMREDYKYDHSLLKDTDLLSIWEINNKI